MDPFRSQHRVAKTHLPSSLVLATVTVIPTVIMPCTMTIILSVMHSEIASIKCSHSLSPVHRTANIVTVTVLFTVTVPFTVMVVATVPVMITAYRTSLFYC